MTDEIRQAMEARLAALEGSEARRARIRARIKTMEHEEEPIVKRKLSVATALVMALMLLGGTALAAGLGLNLFEFFGESEERWLNLADQSVLETQAPITVQNDRFGDAQATITNAYFDGTSLQIAYVVQNGLVLDSWAPTSAELATLKSMGKLYEPSGRPAILDAAPWRTGQQSLRDMIEQTEKAKKAVGFIFREILPAERLTANGAEVVPWNSELKVLEDGTYYEIIDSGVTLPDEIMGQELLKLRMPMSQTVSYYWFTGTEWYSRTEGPDEVGALTATVYRADPMDTVRFTGRSVIQGVPVTVTAEVSTVTGTLTVTAEEDMFYYGYRDGKLHMWLADLTNEKGELLVDQGIQWEYSHNELGWIVSGTGALPKELTLLLYEYDSDGPVMKVQEARTHGTIIKLTAE